MKKVIVTVIFFISLFVYSSCLGEGGNAIELAEQPVVVQLSNDEPEFVLHSGGGSELIPNTSFAASTGESYLVSYKIDFEASENSNDDGIYHVTLVGSPKFVSQYPLSKTVSDTTRILENERTINSLDKRFGYVLDRLFLYANYSITDTMTIVNTYDLSFPDDQLGDYNENLDAAVYTLFLRTQKEENGIRTSDKVFVDVNSFYLYDFVNKFGTKELNNGNDKLHFKVVYPKSFNQDTTSINWGESDIFTLTIE